MRIAIKRDATIVDEDGTEHDILRDNMAFGDPGRGEFGTYYIAYAADPSVTEQMLDNMFIGNPPGNYDHILDVSTALTGSLFFVPSLDLLESLPDDVPAQGRPAAGRPDTEPDTSTTESRRTFRRNSAARRVVDVTGPLGLEAAAANTGHLSTIDPPRPGIRSRLREVAPLVELRVPFSVSRAAVDDVLRGAQDSD